MQFTDINEAKESILKEILSEGRTVSVVVFPQTEGVQLPAHLMNEQRCVLRLSYRFGRPLQIDSVEGVLAQLSFQDQLATVILPWDSITMISSGNDAHVFPDLKSLKLLSTPPQNGEVLLDRSEEFGVFGISKEEEEEEEFSRTAEYLRLVH
jgi:stringent starvation protein B